MIHFTAFQVENYGFQQLVNEPTLQEMDKFIQQISWGNRRLLSVVLLWKQYKGLGFPKNSRFFEISKKLPFDPVTGMCTLYDEDRKRFLNT